MNNILLVIVLYRNILQETATFKSLIMKNPDLRLFVYDNSPSSQQIDRDCTVYIHNPQNDGLGVAYNTAAKYAKEHGFDWLLLMDQDTTFPERALQAYEDAIATHRDVEMIVPKHRIADGRYISPTKYLMKTSYPRRKVKSGYVSFREAAPINSGILVSVASFFKAGGYDPEVTLDFSDVRFIEKYKKQYDGFYVMDIECLQDFSVNENDVNKLMPRYLIYLECAKNCKRERWFDNLSYLLVTLKRTMRLMLQTRRIDFLKAYYLHYIR